MEEKGDKVLPGNIFILISFKGKDFTQINSQQMNTFRITAPVDCAIQIIFNLDAVDKGGSCYIGNDLNMMRIHSGVNKT